jgi:hypothetical protein
MSARVALATLIVGVSLGAVPATAADTVEVTNLGIASGLRSPVFLGGGELAFVAAESEQGEDLNGDGDATDGVPHVFDPATGTTTNLGVAGRFPVALDGGGVAFSTFESGENVDLNGDGDFADLVIHVHDPDTGTTTNLGIAGGFPVGLQGGRVAFAASEFNQGTDLNGDGDTADAVVHVYDPGTGITNVGIAGSGLRALEGGDLAFISSERGLGTDLNGDGDTDDGVPHVYQPATGTTTHVATAGFEPTALDGGNLAFQASESGQGTDLNGDGDTADNVPHMFDVAAGTATNIGISGRHLLALDGGRLMFTTVEPAEDADLNGDEDLFDVVVHVHDPAAGTTTNLGIALSFGDDHDTKVPLEGGSLAFWASESRHGSDLTGDGDTDDDVVQVHDPATATTTNIGIAGTLAGFEASLVAMGGGGLAFAAHEPDVGVDLNGDGDASDPVAHVHDPETGTTVNTAIDAVAFVALSAGTVGMDVFEGRQGVDLNGDGDTTDHVPHVFDQATGTSTNVGIAGSLVFGGSAQPDGRFVMLASEAGEGADLNGDGDSDDFVPHLIAFAGASDTEAPVVSATAAIPNPVATGTPVELTAIVDDDATGGSTIVAAGYSIDGSAEVALAATDGAFDESTESVSGEIAAFATPGIREVCVTGTDASGNVSGRDCVLLAVYDPDGGFVTGGGWIDSPPGAYPEDPDAAGRASFGFVSRYHKGASTPDGQTQFRFRAAGLTFHSTAYDWLVVAGARAQYKGSGTVNGAEGHGFLLTAIDGDLNGGGGVDRLRLKVWDQSSGDVVYDNQMGDDDSAEASTALGGGSITIHHR